MALVVVLGLVVLGRGLNPGSPPSGSIGPAQAASQLFAGFDQPADLPASSLAPLFGASSPSSYPQVVYPPPAGPMAAAPSTNPVLIGDRVDVQMSTGVPTDFDTYVQNAVAAGISRFDSMYKDATFNFGNAARATHFGLLITTDRSMFSALVHTTSFRSGYMDPCPNATADRNLCVPRVVIYFDSAQWSNGEYPPMTAPRIEHEVFHVAHFYLLRSLGHADLFSIPGYYWQTEGFATFTQRTIPDPEAYLTFTTNLLQQGFFSWPSVTDTSYEDSYASAPFLDEMVYQSGNNPAILLNWLRSAQAGYPSSLSLMTTVAPGPNDSVNISRFQRLWLGSMVDLYFPGLLPSTDARTVSVGPALPSPAASITTDAQASATVAVPPIGVKELRLAIGSLSDSSNANLNLSLTSDMPANERALIMLVRGDESDNLPFCYQRLASAGAATVSGAQQCLSDHVRLLDVVARGGNLNLKVSVADIKSFSQDVTKVSIVVFVAHTIADVNPSDLVAMHVTLTAAGDLLASSHATLDLTATGEVAGSAAADTLSVVPGSDGRCGLDSAGVVFLVWKVSIAGQDYYFGIGITYHGPGTYAVNSGGSIFLERLSEPTDMWNEDDAGSVIVQTDGRSGTFAADINHQFNPYHDPSRQHVSGTFACTTPIH